MQKISFKTLLLVLGTTLITVSACRKSKDVVSNTNNSTSNEPAVSGNGIADSVLKDSILYYSRDLYLWNKNIPADFNARSFTGPEELMVGIRPYSIEPGFSNPVDRWSFAMKQKDWDNMSGGLNLLVQDDVTSAGDFGLTVFFLAEGDLRVRLVEPNSPAGKAGIHRGWQITKINGSTNISTTNASFIISKIYESTSTSLTFKKPDGSSETISLNAGHYTEKPVYMDSVYTVGSKKIGYLVYNSFLGDEAKVTSEFQRVFSKFASNNVNDVVIDLRYNGGGYVSLQEKLADYLINSAGDGGMMMKQIYNDKNSQSNETTNFHKTGSLNLGRIYFIVSSSTASASELLINNLKPYLDVRLVGPAHTHGKPVGFFPIPVGKEWYVFPVSFRSVNKNGEGNYFNGLAVNNQVEDGLDKDWGDASEACLASVIRNITTGRYAGTTLSGQRLPSAEVTAGNAALDDPFLKITVDKKRF
jgi:C-terminal processing protease CtpA/Prc